MEPLCGVQMRDKGVIVWEGRKCMQTGTAIASTGFTLLLRELPIYQVARKSRVYLMVTKHGKAEERMCSQEK